MCEAKVMYTELETQSLTSYSREFSEVDKAKEWAEEIFKNGMWHEHSATKIVFVPPSNIHKISIEH